VIGASARSLLYRRRLFAGERLYGLGDKTVPLDRRGRRYLLWNTDALNFRAGSDPLYKSIAVLFGVRGDAAWAIVVDSAARLEVDCRGDEVLVHGLEGATVHEFEAGSLAEALGQASLVAGRAPLPPRWSLGYHQSRWSYGTADEALQVAAEFRRRDIPLDCLHLDIDYMDGYRVFTWNVERFPDPAEFVRSLHELGVRVVTIVDPGVKVDPGYPVYEELVARDLVCTGQAGQPWVGRVWPGDAVWPDFTNPRTRSFWAECHRGLVELGVDGIWIDMNEPSVPGEGRAGTLPDDVRHATGLHAEVHNAYAHLMAQATVEGLERLRPGLRPFVLTRAAALGTQRYAATWTGDNHSTWTHLRLALTMCLGLGLSCYPFCGADVGGFAGRCDPELYARWMQLGAFTPFFRGHYAGPRTPGRQEPWSFGPEVEAVARSAIELRHRLLPYTYTAFWRHTQTGLPVMRPLALGWPDDPHAVACEDAFLWGDELLVAPVLRKGARRRRVYLPSGGWYDFWTNRRVEGGRNLSLRVQRLSSSVRISQGPSSSSGPPGPGSSSGPGRPRRSVSRAAENRPLTTAVAGSTRSQTSRSSSSSPYRRSDERTTPGPESSRPGRGAGGGPGGPAPGAVKNEWR
jgi:alpha-glucosidase